MSTVQHLKNENFREAVNAFLAVAARENGAVLRTRYELGRLAAEVKKKHDESGGKYYGTSDPLRDMSNYVDSENNENFLNECRLYFETFTADEMEAMCQRRADGSTMSWNHVRYLRVIKVSEVRTKLLQRCIKECWTAPRLRKEIVALSNEDRGRPNNKKGQGRPIAKPTSALGLLEQEEVWTNKLSDRLNIWNSPDHSIVAHLKNEVDNMTDEELRSIEEAIRKRRDCTEKLIASLNINIAIFSEASDIIKAALDARSAKTDKEPDDDMDTDYKAQEEKKYSNARRRVLQSA